MFVVFKIRDKSETGDIVVMIAPSSYYEKKEIVFEEQVKLRIKISIVFFIVF